MAQQIVRDQEDDIRDRRRTLTAKHGRGMEEEVREILGSPALGAATHLRDSLGTRLVKHFRGADLTGHEIEELRACPVRPAAFDS